MSVGYPPGAIVVLFVPSSPSEPQPSPSVRRDLGCRMVAAALSGGLERGSWGTIYLQIAGGPHRSRTGHLRRAKAALSQLS